MKRVEAEYFHINKHLHLKLYKIRYFGTRAFGLNDVNGFRNFKQDVEVSKFFIFEISNKNRDFCSVPLMDVLLAHFE